MISLPFNELALAGSPTQWAVAALLAVIIFAPRLLPPLARLLASLVEREMRRRLGLPPRPVRRVSRPLPDRPEIEVLPPESPRPTLRANNPAPLASPPPAPSVKPVWLTMAVVCAAIGVLLWFLLHTR